MVRFEGEALVWKSDKTAGVVAGDAACEEEVVVANKKEVVVA